MPRFMMILCSSAGKKISHVAVSVGTRNISCSVSHETEIQEQVNTLSHTQSDLTFLIH